MRTKKYCKMGKTDVLIDALNYIKNFKGQIILNSSTFDNNRAFPLLSVEFSSQIIIDSVYFAFQTMTCCILANIQNIKIYHTIIYGCKSQSGVSGILIQSSWKNSNPNYSVLIYF